MILFIATFSFISTSNYTFASSLSPEFTSPSATFSPGAFSIIPEPVRVTPGENSFFIDNNTVILAQGEQEYKSATFLRNYLEKHYGLVLTIVRDKVKPRKNKKGELRYIDLKTGTIAYDIAGFNPSDLKLEGAYLLNISEGIASLKGANPTGLFYAVQTLIQLLPDPAGNNPVPVKEAHVVDYPGFSYRGMHLDVVKHMFPVEYVKKYIDYLALHKMNYFHWHLTDDQGWRIESKKYPKLNETGSWRAGTIIGLFPGTGVDSTRYGGYYTADEIRDIINYASDRFIEIIPEIEIPGHCMALTASYPQFSTTPDIPGQPAITWEIFDNQNNVLAPSEDLFKFLEGVFNELMDLFPGEYIHIGADECSKIWWKESSATQQFMKRYGLADEDALQAYFVKRVSKIVTDRGRKIVGWEEILEGELPADAVVMSKRVADYGWKAAEMGYKAILTPQRHSFFNFAQRPDEDSLCHRDFIVTLESVYNFEPVPEWIAPSVATNILGGQGSMWTEYYPTVARLEYALFPRISAISEVYWSQKKNRDFTRFKAKLRKQFERYELWGTNYSKYD